MVHDKIFDRGEWRVITDVEDRSVCCPVCRRKVEHMGDCPHYFYSTTDMAGLYNYLYFKEK